MQGNVQQKYKVQKRVKLLTPHIDKDYCTEDVASSKSQLFKRCPFSCKPTLLSDFKGKVPWLIVCYLFLKSNLYPIIKSVLR